jgi:hypothetical protein
VPCDIGSMILMRIAVRCSQLVKAADLSCFPVALLPGERILDSRD